MDERLQKQYEHQFKFWRKIIEFVILPTILWVIVALVLNPNDYNIQIRDEVKQIKDTFRDIKNFLCTPIIREVFLLPSIIYSVYLSRLFYYIRNGFSSDSSIKVFKKVIYILISVYFLLVSIRLIKFIVIIVTFFMNTGNLTIITSFYSILLLISKFLLKNIFIDDRIVVWFYRKLALIDLDKGYMNYHYLIKIRKEGKKYIFSVRELKEIMKSEYSDVTSNLTKKKLKEVKKHWNEINKSSKLRANLFKYN